jgi:putative ABC transport system permease protein
MSFVWRMAWREMRTSWGRLLFFFLCVAIGVAAIIVLRSVVQNVRITLTREARTIVGADVVVQSSRPLDAAVRDRVLALIAEHGGGETADLVDTQTMAAAVGQMGTGAVRLVEVRGLPPGFPFYGAMELEGGRPYSHTLVESRGVLVQPEVLGHLGLRVGDALRIAGQAFTIRGVVTRDRVQRSSGIALGPRIYVDVADLRRTALLGFGSRASYLLAGRADERRLEDLAKRIRDEFPRETLFVRTWKGLEDRLGRNLTIAENYLSLVGFAVVVLGGIGVWSVTRVVVQQKIRSVAILKTLGASSRRVLATYVLQVSWLAAAGGIVGLMIAMLTARAIPASVLTSLGVTDVHVTTSAAVQGIAVGWLVSLLFAVVPLLEMRRVKPLLLLRADTMTSARRRDWVSAGAGIVVATALALVAMWQAGSVAAGLYVTGGLAIVGLVLAVASRLVVRLLLPLARSPRFALRHAIVSLGRPGNQTRVILMAVGLGCFFILTVRLMQVSLLDELDIQVGVTSPDFILIDIQPDQLPAVEQTATSFARQPPRLMPLLRARVVGVDGAVLKLANVDEVRKHGELTREFGLTFRNGLERNETLVGGAFWTAPLTGPAAAGVDTEVSIEEEARGDAGLQLGDVIRFDVGGRVLTARVTSVRKVAWEEFQNGGFVFVLRPGPAVQAVAHSFVGFVQVGEDAGRRVAFQRALIDIAPNVSAIDVRDVVQAIRSVVDNVTLGVTVVGAVMLVGGLAILVGAVAMTRFQRLYEAAIYRTLGASTRLLGTMVFIEYGLLGLVAGLLGAGGAMALSYLLSTYLFEIDWLASPGLVAGAVLLTAALVSTIGLAASLDVLRRKPLGTLRSE